MRNAWVNVFCLLLRISVNVKFNGTWGIGYVSKLTYVPCDNNCGTITFPLCKFYFKIKTFCAFYLTQYRSVNAAFFFKNL